MSNPLVDMQKPDVIFCIGTNMTECHPVAATGLKKAVARGAKLIVADPRRIGLADISDLYLPLRVGSDTALLLGMAHVIAREGLINDEFIKNRTTGFDEFFEHISEWTPEWAEEITGVPAKDIEKAAIWYGATNKGAIYYTLGITEHICGVENVQSLCNLALMTGNMGARGRVSTRCVGRTTFKVLETVGRCQTTIPVSKPSRIQNIRRSLKRHTARRLTWRKASPKSPP